MHGGCIVSRKYAARHCGRDDRELIEAGFKVLVKKFHPDMGGRTQKMRGLNAVMGKLPKPKKRMTWTKHCTGSGRTFARRNRHGRVTPQ